MHFRNDSVMILQGYFWPIGIMGLLKEILVKNRYGQRSSWLRNLGRSDFSLQTKRGEVL